MKKYSIIIIGIMFHLSIVAQSISVTSFKLLYSDLTANTSGTMEQDQNGETAALIKVVTTQTGFTFDGGALGIVKTKQTPGEVWVYVPKGSKKITIKHPQLGVLRDYYYPIAIEAAKTYELVLSTGTIETIVKQTSNSQYLVLKVTPADAIVELNNEVLPTSDGIAQKFVKLGTYNYRVQANNYHTAAGRVDVTDPGNKKVLEINLDPAFGWIEIPSHQEYDGAQVFIDNTLAGTIPMKSKDLPSGEHNVKIVKSLYNPYSQTIVVKDNETTLVTPTLSANFSEVTITVDNDADIYVNDEKKSTGSWTGKLSFGNYQLEAKKEGHRSTIQNVEISSSQTKTQLHLPSPTPIYGEVNITSSPAMADVFIDDKNVGQTPLYLPQIIIGTHKVVIKREGYGDYESSLVVKESQSATVAAELKNQVIVKIRANTTTASIYIDGDFLGKGNVEKLLTIGNHQIEVKDDIRKYINYNENVRITSENNIIDVFLEEKNGEISFCYDYKPYANRYIYISIDGGEFYAWGEKEKTYPLTSKGEKEKDELKRPLTLGQHMIVVRHQGVDEIRKTIEVNHKNKRFVISFRKRTIEPY